MKFLKIISLLFLFSTLLTSCEEEETVKASTFPELSGHYVYSIDKTWNNGLYEEFAYVYWEFDNTCKAKYYSCSWSYTKDGWRNATKESYRFTNEWKIENGKFHERLWDNDYSDWRAYDFEYIDERNFKLNGKLYTKEN